MDFNEILRVLMDEKHLTQNALAKRMKVTQGQVSEWLNGRSKPSYDNLKLLCITLNISGDEILGLTPLFKQFLQTPCGRS